MKLKEIISSMKAETRAEAEEFMKSEEFTSMRDFGDGYEALIFIEEKLLLPQVVLAPDDTVLEHECQCGFYNRKRKNKDYCVHVAAIFLGIEKMKEADCYDYHDAVIFLNSKNQ
jgi:hypothetical protein